MTIFLALLENQADELAFIEMYQKHLPMLTRTGQRFFTDKSFVEDALQMTWESVAVNFSKISSLPCHETAPYLVTIMKNKCRDILRSERKFEELVPEEETIITDDIVDMVHIQDEYRKLVDEIRKMPDIYREVLERRLILEQSNSETAKSIGISAALTAKRFSRGRDMLKKKLLDSGGAEFE